MMTTDAVMVIHEKMSERRKRQRRGEIRARKDNALVQAVAKEIARRIRGPARMADQTYCGETSLVGQHLSRERSGTHLASGGGVSGSEFAEGSSKEHVDDCLADQAVEDGHRSCDTERRTASPGEAKASGTREGHKLETYLLGSIRRRWWMT